MKALGEPVAFPPDAYLDARQPTWKPAEAAGHVRYVRQAGTWIVLVSPAVPEIIAMVREVIRQKERLS